MHEQAAATGGRLRGICAGGAGGTWSRKDPRSGRAINRKPGQLTPVLPSPAKIGNEWVFLQVGWWELESERW